MAYDEQYNMCGDTMLKSNVCMSHVLLGFILPQNLHTVTEFTSHKSSVYVTSLPQSLLITYSQDSSMLHDKDAI